MQRDNYLKGIVKEAWREEIEKYLQQMILTCLLDVKKAKVLFLPGPHAYELEIYLRLGFKIENLVGLERSESREKTISKRNPLLNVVQMDSSDFVYESKEQFDVISFDTENMFNEKQVDTIDTLFRRRLISPHGIVILNYFEGHTSKRDKDFLLGKYKGVNLFEARRLAPIETLQNNFLRHKLSFEMQCIAYRSPSPMFTVAAWYSKKPIVKTARELLVNTVSLGSEKRFTEVYKHAITTPKQLRMLSKKLGTDEDCLYNSIVSGYNFDFKELVA